jgi:aspartyl aminopeptidase
MSKDKIDQQKSSLQYEKQGFYEFKKGKEKEVVSFSEDYKAFLGQNKTEIECGRFIYEFGKNKKYELIDLKNHTTARKSKSGTFYGLFERKVPFLARTGKKPVTDGINFIFSHSDSPRMDLKPVSLFEEGGLTLFKTHYYGGIKKYLWVTQPMAIHGTFFLKGGKTVDIVIGEDKDDPVFTISDLLIHLSKSRMEKVAKEVISGEELNLIVGSLKTDKDIKNPFKELFLEKLNKKYGVVEKDFLSSEIEIVPAMEPRDLGLDRSMIFAYGHDNKSSCYTSFRGLIDAKECSRFSVMLWFDREEIGSNSITGADSNIIRFVTGKLLESQGVEPTEMNISQVLANSNALNADVSNLHDPTYSDVDDKLNVCEINKGVNITKCTGSGGKYRANDAQGEIMSRVIEILDDQRVNWQVSTLGRLEAGGGGTTSVFVAKNLINSVDIGIGVLNMHAMQEIASRADVFSCYEACKSFYEKF